MISVIVCSARPPGWNLHRRNVARTLGAPHEYMRIDNTAGRYGLGAAYNLGVRQALGDLLVFVHEDVFFMEAGWGEVLRGKFEADPRLGLVGVAGTQYLCAGPVAWDRAGQPFLRGHLVQETTDGRVQALNILSWDRADAEVVVVDGLFMAVRRSLFERVRFDEATFDHFHFYDLDLCMQVRTTHRLVVTWDILVKHFSEGSLGGEWRRYADRFAAMYAHVLPASCTEGAPDPARHVRAEAIDLRGKAPTGVPV